MVTSHTTLNSSPTNMELAGLKIFFLVLCLCTSTVPEASKRLSEKLNELQKNRTAATGIQFFSKYFKVFVFFFFVNFFIICFSMKVATNFSQPKNNLT